jgi:hypothetical protein
MRLLHMGGSVLELAARVYFQGAANKVLAPGALAVL